MFAVDEIKFSLYKEKFIEGTLRVHTFITDVVTVRVPVAVVTALECDWRDISVPSK